LAAELPDELGVGPGLLGPADVELDGQAEEVGVVGGGREPLWRPVGQYGVDEGLDAVVGHRAASGARRAVVRRGQPGTTLALLTLIAMRCGSLLDGVAGQEPQRADAAVLLL
jgi:hypothetical protein